MKTYPKFLKAMPSFFGLGPVDLLGLGIGLFISLLLNLSPIFALVSSAILMGASKLFRTYFDVVGLLLPKKKTIILTERR